jgi:hypothetical protein
LANTYLPNSQASLAMEAMIPHATSVWLSLHTASPGQTGANESSGGSYARQSITFGAASSGVQTSTTAQSFTNMPASTVAYFGEWSAVTSGTYLLGSPLSSSLTVPAGSTVSCAIAAITQSVQG